MSKVLSTNGKVKILKINVQPDPLEIVVESMKKVNDYDYNKMIEEFKLMEVKEKKKKERVIKR